MVLQAKSVQPKPFAAKTPRSKGAAPTDDKSVPLQTKAVQTRQPKQPAAKKTSAQRQQPAQNLVETKWQSNKQSAFQKYKKQTAKTIY